jgi:hypothetical protein
MTAAWEMISAEFLKLRKRRGLFWWSLILTVGAALLTFAILEILHLANPDHHGPAGSLDNINGMAQALGALGGLTAVLIGTTAGSGDVSAGVFRDFVTTGRSRLALFAVRPVGGALMLLPLLLLGYAVVLVVAYGFNGSLATPSAGLMTHFGVWLIVGRLLDLCMAVGFAALIGSRGIAIGVLLGWLLAIGPILTSIKLFGVFREAVSTAATDRIRPLVNTDTHLLSMSLAAAVIVIVIWAAVFLSLGAWRTVTQDA